MNERRDYYVYGYVRLDTNTYYSKGGYYKDTMLEANLHFININN